MKPFLYRLGSSAMLVLGALHWARVADALEPNSSGLGSLGLSVSGYLERGEMHREYGGWLALSVPLERFAGTSSTPSKSLTDAHSAADASRIDNAPLEPTDAFGQWTVEHLESADEALELEQLSEPAEGGEAGEPAASTEAARGASMSEGANAATLPEPVAMTSAMEGVWRLSSAQLRGLVAAVVAEDARRLARITSLSDRARSSAWLPEFKFRAGRNSDQTLRLTPTLEEPDRWALTGGSGLRFEGELRWQFDRLVFASEEVSIERVRLLLEQQRQRGILDLLQWVFRWQVAVMRTHDADLSPSDRLLATLQAEQTSGALDVLSAGWFSAHIRLPNTPASER